MRQTKKLLDELLEMSISTGAISEMEARSGQVMEKPVEELRKFITASPVLHLDETSWFQQHKRHWLWVAVTQGASIFKITKGRSRKDSEALLNKALLEILGVVVSDRWGAYSNLPVWRCQLCWAHIKRDFQKIAEAAPPGAKRKARSLVKQSRRLFELWRCFQSGRCSRSYPRYQLNMLKISVETILQELGELTGFRHAGMCRKILSEKDSLWTFVSQQGVRPDNNTAERALRHSVISVICRKLSFGTKSEEGSQFMGASSLSEPVFNSRGAPCGSISKPCSELIL